MGNFLLIVGGGFLMAVVAIPIAVYLNDRERRNGKGRSLVLFSAGVVVAGMLSSLVFLYAIGPGLCSIIAGESCAWTVGIAGTPAFFAFGIGGFVYAWKQRGRAP